MVYLRVIPLLPFRLGAVKGVSDAPFCATSFFKMGNKRPSTLRMGMRVDGQFFGIQLFEFAGDERLSKLFADGKSARDRATAR